MTNLLLIIAMVASYYLSLEVLCESPAFEESFQRFLGEVVIVAILIGLLVVSVVAFLVRLRVRLGRPSNLRDRAGGQR
jgi:hypothetical protein